MSDHDVQSGDIIAVWFSCGAASAVAAKKTLEKYGDIADVRVVNSPIVEEHPDNQRFLDDVEAWLGVSYIEYAVNPKFPNCSTKEVWERAQFMSSPYGAPCTVALKKEARQHWELSNRPDWHVLGFTVEEKKRHEMFCLTERDNVLPVLIEAGLTKQDCAEIVWRAGLKLPKIYELGYPNANCIGCVKATSPTYWNHVRKVHPAVFEDRAHQSREIGARLVRVKGERIFLDELDPTAKGNAMKSLKFDCGLFCEEYREED